MQLNCSVPVFWEGGMRGCGGVHGCRGACMAGSGGVHGCGVACVVAGGACVAAGGGMRGCRGACMVAGGVCMVAGGHAWLWGGCAWLQGWGACVVVGGHAWSQGGHAWLQGGGCAWLWGLHVWLQGGCAWLQGGCSCRGGLGSCDLSHHAFDVTCMLPPHQLSVSTCAAPYIVWPRCMLGYTHAPPPPVNRMTNRCKNITLPQTSFAGGKNTWKFI